MASQVPARSAWAKGPPVRVPGASSHQAQASPPATAASGLPIHTSNVPSVARPSPFPPFPLPAPPLDRPPLGVSVPPPQWGFYYYPGMQMDPNYNPYPTPPWTLPQHLPLRHPPLGPLGVVAPGPSPLLSHPAAQPRPEPLEPSGVGVSPGSTPKVNTLAPKLRVTIKSESGQELDLEKWRAFTLSQARVRRTEQEQRARIVAEANKGPKAAKAAHKAMRKAEKARRDAERRARAPKKRPIPSEVDRSEREVATPLDADEGKVAREEMDEVEEGLWKKIQWDWGSEREEADDASQEAEEKAQGQASATAAGEELELELLWDELDFAVAEEINEEYDTVSELKVPLWSTFTSAKTKRYPTRPGLQDSESKDPSDHGSASSVLAKARPIWDIRLVRYPEGVMGPKADLNVNAAPGRFRYDRDFLLQFMPFCKDKPDNNNSFLDEIGIAPLDETWTHLGRSWTRNGSRSSSTGAPSSRPHARSGPQGPCAFRRFSTNPFTVTGDSGTHLQLSRPPPKVRGALTDFGKLVKRAEPSFLWNRSHDSGSKSRSLESTNAGEDLIDTVGNTSETAPGLAPVAEPGPAQGSEGSIDSLPAGWTHSKTDGTQAQKTKTGKLAVCKADLKTEDDNTFAKTSRDPGIAPEESSRPGREEGCLAPRGMSDEEANQQIDRTVTMLSGLHNISTVLAVFQGLPPEYHSRLVDRLVSRAIKCNADADAQVIAYFLHCAAERRMCSPAAFEDGISTTASTLGTIAEEFPDAVSRYATIIQGTGIHEDPNWRDCVLGKTGIHGPRDELELRLLSS